jgi:hypothetical protein
MGVLKRLRVALFNDPVRNMDRTSRFIEAQTEKHEREQHEGDFKFTPDYCELCKADSHYFGWARPREIREKHERERHAGKFAVYSCELCGAAAEAFWDDLIGE